jgi:hypothetical protein
VACGVRGSAFVEALVLGEEHVERSLGHCLGGPVFGQPGLERLARDLLEADRLAQHLGHDLRHVVEGEVLGAEDRHAALSAPGAIEQQPGCDDGDVAGGAGLTRIFSSWLAPAPPAANRRHRDHEAHRPSRRWSLTP